MYRLVLTGILMIFLATLSGQIPIQSHSIIAFSVEDGLSQSSVQSISQDVFGFLWISTGDGLNCFDGNSFARYYFNPFSQGSEQSNGFRNVISDSLGNLWIGTNLGLLYLDRSKELLEQPFPEIQDLVTQSCLPLFSCDDSIFVIVSGSGLLKIHKKSRNFTKIKLANRLTALTISEISNNEKWFGVYPSSLIRATFEPEKGLILKEFNLGNLGMGEFQGVIKLSGEKYLFATSSYIMILSELTGDIEQIDYHSWHLLQDNSSFTAVGQDKTGSVWLATNNHEICILDKNLKPIQFNSPLLSKNKNQEGFSNISKIYTDREGNTWLGSDGSGLGLFNQPNNKFSRVGNIQLPNGEVIKPFVRCFLQDEDNKLWIGTFNAGLICWDKSNNTFEQVKFTSGAIDHDDMDLYSLFTFDDHKILAGTYRGLWIVDTKNLVAEYAGDILKGNSNQKITAILPKGTDTFILLLNNGIFMLEYRNIHWQIHNTSFPDSIFYYKLYQSGSGILYAFSSGSLFWEQENKIYQKSYSLDGKNVSLKINAVHEDPSGSFWLATNHGLVLMNKSGEIIQTYGENEGLPNHYLYGILSDQSGKLWISSNRGISEFDLQTKNFINYGMDDGLQSLEFNSGAFYKNQQGALFFGGIKGFNFFNPDSARSEKYKTKIYIRKIYVNDQPYLTDTCSLALKTIQLKYNQNTLTFEFIGLDYLHPENINFEYKLEGHENNWISSGNSNRVRYSKIPPGIYSFKVRAADRFGQKEENLLVLQVVIQKPFWMKISFLLISGLIIIGFISLAVWYFSTIKMKNQIAQLKRNREIRSKIAADLHDDVGSGLSKLAMISDKARMQSKDMKEYSNYLTKISKEARQMIDQLRVIVWALNPQDDKLDGLYAYIHHQISDYLEDYPVKFEMIIPEQIPIRTITPEIKRNVFYVIREAVHNATKHSEASEIKINFESSRNRLKAIIQDNGIGFYMENTTSFGNGIQFSKKRIADLGGEFSIKSLTGVGTTVEIEIPI